MAFHAAAGAAPLAAQDVPIDVLRPLGPGGSVEIDVVQHTITIEVWTRNEVQVTGSYNSAFEDLDVDADDESFNLDIDRENVRGNGGGGDLIVRIPANVFLEAQSVSGAVRATGNLRAAGLESVSGPVAYVGDAEEVALYSVSGSVSYSGNASEADLSSVSGGIRAAGSFLSLDAETVSGEIVVASQSPMRELSAETVSGGISYTGGLAPGGEISVESFSGRVELLVPTTVAARFDLETFSGSINVSLPGIPDDVAQSARFGPSETATFVTGNGNGSIEASSMSGSIVIRSP
jgi:DUF4097 and DUF4098 domain-containing protein YvlB